MNNLLSLESVLKDKGKSVTVTRKTVFDAFIEHDALSMKQLIDIVSKKIDRASAYRTVDLFVEMGILNRIQIGWKYKLELSEQFSDHHHHISCKKCHRVDILKGDEVLEEHIGNIAKNVKYNLTRHTIDLVGICQDCQ